jgi:hypothetical protein
MEAINWQAIQAISETLGLIVVVGSLVFVGFEVRQSVKATRAATMNNIMGAWGDVYRGFSESENIAEVIWKGVQDPAVLSEPDQWRYSLQIAGLFHNFHNAHYQWKIGAYDDGAWSAQAEFLTNLLSLPGVRSVWDERKRMLSKDFQVYVDTQILTKDADKDYKLTGT